MITTFLKLYFSHLGIKVSLLKSYWIVLFLIDIKPAYMISIYFYRIKYLYILNWGRLATKHPFFLQPQRSFANVMSAKSESDGLGVNSDFSKRFRALNQSWRLWFLDKSFTTRWALSVVTERIIFHGDFADESCALCVPQVATGLAQSCVPYAED